MYVIRNKTDGKYLVGKDKLWTRDLQKAAQYLVKTVPIQRAKAIHDYDISGNIKYLYPWTQNTKGPYEFEILHVELRLTEDSDG